MTGVTPPPDFTDLARHRDVLVQARGGRGLPVLLLRQVRGGRGLPVLLLRQARGGRGLPVLLLRQARGGRGLRVRLLLRQARGGRGLPVLLLRQVGLHRLLDEQLQPAHPHALDVDSGRNEVDDVGAVLVLHDDAEAALLLHNTRKQPQTGVAPTLHNHLTQMYKMRMCLAYETSYTHMYMYMYIIDLKCI